MMHPVHTGTVDYRWLADKRARRKERRDNLIFWGSLMIGGTAYGLWLNGDPSILNLVYAIAAMR